MPTNPTETTYDPRANKSFGIDGTPVDAITFFRHYVSHAFTGRHRSTAKRPGMSINGSVTPTIDDRRAGHERLDAQHGVATAGQCSASCAGQRWPH